MVSASLSQVPLRGRRRDDRRLFAERAANRRRHFVYPSSVRPRFPDRVSRGGGSIAPAIRVWLGLGGQGALARRSEPNELAVAFSIGNRDHPLAASGGRNDRPPGFAPPP